MQQLYTNVEAASLLGIPDATIRSWLSRYPEAFQIGTHLIEEGKKKLWTEQGLELLRQRAAENAAKDAVTSDASATQPAIETAAKSVAPATEPATQRAANNDAPAASFNDALIEGFTDKLSLEIAGAIAERLPSRVLHHVNRMLHQNPTQQEAEILHHATQQQLQLLPGVEGKYLALPQSK